MDNLGRHTIFIFEAASGMVLAKDVFLSDGHLALAAGTVLDNDTITTLSGLHVLEISVEDEKTDEGKVKNYFDKVRDSEDFKKFNSGYEKNVALMKEKLNDIVVNGGAAVRPDEILMETNQLLASSKSSLQLFDMLHSMRSNDDLTYVHSINVSLIATVIGRWLKLPEADVRLLTISGMLHDIGKLMIPEEILKKPGKLTDEEYDMMKSHVKLGYAKLQDSDLEQEVKEAVLLHHERCDGTGYPFGITGDKIPLFAKIISVADVYDAMTASRVYRGSMCPFDVIHIMEDDAFSKYDPKVLLPFLNNVVSSYLHNNVRLSDGRVAEVVLINKHRLSKPSVICGDTFIDLSKTSGLNVKEIL